VAKSAQEKLLMRLRQLRAKHGLSQEAFAELAGMSYKHYQALEAGRKHEVRFSTLVRVAETYGIEIYELLAPKPPQTNLKKTFIRLRRGRPPKGEAKKISRKSKRNLPQKIAK
jgi:transcriptional regulator with XRE-family HTH domain